MDERIRTAQWRNDTYRGQSYVSIVRVRMTLYTRTTGQHIPEDTKICGHRQGTFRSHKSSEVRRSTGHEGPKGE